MSLIQHIRQTHIRISLVICICFFVTRTADAQKGIEALPVIQTADRVSLYPRKDRPDSRNFVYPSVIRKNGTLILFTSRQFDLVEMISGNGTLVFQENIKGRTGRFDIPLRNGASGINYVRLRDRENMLIQKVMIIE